jgi:hypothetical protein
VRHLSQQGFVSTYGFSVSAVRDWEVASRPIGGGGRAQWLAPPTRTLRPDIARDDRPRARDGGARDAGDLGGVSGKFSVIIKN